MNGDLGTEKPCLMGDVPPVFLLNCVGDFICVKRYSPRTEQAYLDWIKRFIHFHGKRHRPRVEAYLWLCKNAISVRSWEYQNPSRPQKDRIQRILRGRRCGHLV
jgi:hypothetical protein